MRTDQELQMKEQMKNREINKMRNHISCVFEKLWMVVILLIGSILSNAQGAIDLIRSLKKGGAPVSLSGAGIVLIILLVVCGFSLLRWYRTTLSVRDGMVIIERRTLNRYTNTISVHNISNINLEQNIFERIIGTYKVKLDTGSLSTADSTDVEIILSRKKAFAVKNLIMDMMNEVQESEKLAAEGEKEPSGVQSSAPVKREMDFMDERAESKFDIVYTGAEIVKNCLVKVSVSSVLIVIGILLSVILPAVLDPESAAQIRQEILKFLVQIFLSLSFIFSILKRWFADYEFKATRQKNKIYVSSGLLKKRKYAVPVEQINAVSFRAGFLGRICGRYYVQAINIGGENEDADGMQILLAQKPETLRAKLAKLLPEMEIPDFERVHRQPASVLIKGILLWFIWITLIFALATGILNLIGLEIPFVPEVAVIAAVYAIAAAGNVLSYLVKSTVIGEKYLIISGGVFGRHIEVIPYEKIQYISLDQGPVERLLHIKSASVNILASAASSSHSSAVYRSEFFDELKERFSSTY